MGRVVTEGAGEGEVREAEEIVQGALKVSSAEIPVFLVLSKRRIWIRIDRLFFCTLTSPSITIYYRLHVIRSHGFCCTWFAIELKVIFNSVHHLRFNYQTN